MTRKILAFILFMGVIGLVAAVEAGAESKFRKDFRTSYQNDRFDALGFLIRSNKAIVPDEIKTLLEDAAKAESFDERVMLLDLANTMATMYKEWHGEAKYLEEVEKVQKAELAKEEARKAELQKWVRYEAFPGNMVMKSSLEKMEAKGLSAVVFPHWIHRLNYECKACHPGVFAMKRGSSALSQAAIQFGKLCGECHNGKESFSAAENCERCHVAGRPAEAGLLSPKKYDLAALKETSRRLGTGLNLETLPKDALPFDRLGNIDWLLLRKLKAYKPKASIGQPSQESGRDTEILFESPIPYVNNVVFGHKVHTDQMQCSACHPDVFKEELGSTSANMTAMAQGASCGACHGKVSFKFADCNRCHSKPVGQPLEKVLQRKK